jgi:hypothetical protein
MWRGKRAVMHYSAQPLHTVQNRVTTPALWNFCCIEIGKEECSRKANENKLWANKRYIPRINNSENRKC